MLKDIFNNSCAWTVCKSEQKVKLKSESGQGDFFSNKFVRRDSTQLSQYMKSQINTFDLRFLSFSIKCLTC